MRQSSLARVAEAKRREPAAALRAAVLAADPPPRLRLSPSGFDVIAEFKLRSPALGNLAAQTQDPVSRLEAYAEGGAAIVSVLTEPERFDGDLEHLRKASEVLAPYGVPAMRKDFLVDPYQVLEARANGASGVLLIIAMLSRDELDAMLDMASQLELFVLLEAFDAHDLSLAREIAAKRAGRAEQILMGLNCRNLETLEVDFDRFARLRSEMPDAWPAVAESGVESAAQAAQVAQLGYRCALIGTALMRRPDPRKAVAELVAAGRGAS
jgi:indole-3-glycerol phosphate synthase